METLRYKRASIRITPWGHQADIVRGGRRFRKTFPGLQGAKDYIDTIDLEFAAGARPLTPAEIEQARKAFAMLPPGTTLLEAVRDYLDRKGPAREDRTIAAAAEEYIDSKIALNLREASILSARAQVRRLEKAFPDHNVADLDGRALDAWLTSLGQSPRTRNNTIRDLNGFLNWCVARGYAAHNPAAILEEARIDKTLPEIRPVKTVENFLTILARDYPELVPFHVVGFFAGVRVDEMLRMGADAFRDGSIHVTPAHAKTRTYRIIEMAPNLRAWLQAFPVPASITLPPVKKLRAARKAAGILPWPQNLLRHSFATYHLAAHRDAARTAHDLGHPNANLLYTTYRTLATPAEGQAYFSILPPDTTQST